MIKHIWEPFGDFMKTRLSTVTDSGAFSWHLIDMSSKMMAFSEFSLRLGVTGAPTLVSII